MAAIPKFLGNFGFPLHSRGNTGVNEVIFVSKSPGGQWPPLRVFCQFFEFCNRPTLIHRFAVPLPPREGFFIT